MEHLVEAGVLPLIQVTSKAAKEEDYRTISCALAVVECRKALPGATQGATGSTVALLFLCA